MPENWVLQTLLLSSKANIWMPTQRAKDAVLS